VLSNPRGFFFWIFFQDFKLPILSLLTSILSKVLQTSNLLSFFPPSIKTNHSSPLKEGYVNKYFPDSNRKLCLGTRAPNDLNSPSTRKGGGRSWRNVWFLGGPWKEKEKHLFTLLHFPPNKFHLNFHFFPLILRFYFTMVLGRYLHIPFFSLTYKLQSHISM
jgi:hypothetical protein